MLGDFRFSKVGVLIEQGRFKEAEKILNDLLSEDPTNTQILAYLSEIKLQLGEFVKARALIDNAIARSPDEGYLFYIKSRIALQQERYDEAEEILDQAIQIDPTDADYFGLWARIKLMRKQYDKALDLADQALALDAENLHALNTRSTALLKLDRKEDSFETINNALREDPNNTFTHSNYGWGLLEKGDHKKALEHFRASLKSDPNNDHAQAGMVEAIKATNPVYRLFLKYVFFMGKLTAKYQWGVIMGIYFGFRFLSKIAEKNPALQPFLYPVLFVLATVAFSTWIIEPISNLFLRFNKYGNFLLDKKEKMSSNFVGASLLVFLIGLCCYLILSDERFISIAVFGFAMLVPFGSMFNPAKIKNMMLIYTILMFVIGTAAVAICFTTGQLLNVMSILFFVGFIAFQWIANYQAIKQSNI